MTSWRTLAGLAIVLVACGDKAATPPDPENFRAMTPEQQCDAAAPRAKRCVDELMVADLRAVTADGEIAAELEKHLGASRATTDEAANMHRLNCRASDFYADAVVRCWQIESCTEFAACVVESRDSHAKPVKPPVRDGESIEVTPRHTD